jgi:glutaconate CoA-transferase subunit A
MTLVSGLRAAAQGVPFMPIAGVFGSDLARTNGWRTVRDPYGDTEVYAIPAVRPDVAVIHAAEVDALGNARVFGTPFWDHPLTRAARRVLVTAERLVPTGHLARQPELTLVPHFMVEAVSIVDRGAWPGSCHPLYGVDYPALQAWMDDSPGALARHLEAAPEREAHD